MSKPKIDPKKIYNLTDMRRLNLFHWVGNYHNNTYKNAVIEDALGENLLKAKITGSGRGRDYKIKGTNIIIYLKSHEKRN